MTVFTAQSVLWCLFLEWIMMGGVLWGGPFGLRQCRLARLLSGWEVPLQQNDTHTSPANCRYCLLSEPCRPCQHILSDAQRCHTRLLRRSCCPCTHPVPGVALWLTSRHAPIGGIGPKHREPPNESPLHFMSFLTGGVSRRPHVNGRKRDSKGPGDDALENSSSSRSSSRSISSSNGLSACEAQVRFPLRGVEDEVN